MKTENLEPLGRLFEDRLWHVEKIVDMFMGAPPERSASVVEMASDYLEPLGLLAAVHADNGLFFMTPEGKIVFQPSGDPALHPVADSFGAFFDRITFHGPEF